MGPYFMLVILSIIGCVELYIVPPTGIGGIDVYKELGSPRGAPQSTKGSKNCDGSQIPTLENFDLKKFSGTWYEVAKTVSGYIDVNDGVWKILASNTSKENSKFLFSGRNNNNHCIRPISGIIRSSNENPGYLTFKYRTYSTYVSENLRVLFTDYESIAVLYACAYTSTETNSCHPAGLLGTIWTRHPHVDISVFDRGAKYLQRACIDKSSLRIRNTKGPCRIEDLGTRDDSFPVPNFCYHAMDAGSCSAKFKRYYYSYEEKKCKEFIFSGCGGNANNFLLQRECENQCIGISTNPSCEKEAPCALSCPSCCVEDKNGCVHCSCSSVVVDLPFIDQCLSNAEECSSECTPEKIRDGCYQCICEGDFIVDGDGRDELAPVCLEVKDKGICGKLLKRYYYNAISGYCEKFNYTGCGGTQNNFLTVVDCEMKCRGFNEIQMANQILDDDDPNSGSALRCMLNLLVLVVVLNWLK